MFKFLFLDLDDTILDFQKAEHIAIRKTLAQFGLEPTDEVCSLYSRINREHWERLERKELVREQVLTGRFAVLFGQMGIEVDPVQVARTYEANLGVGHYFLPGAEEAVKSLYKKYRLFLASNGTAKVQAGRLESAGIQPYFEKIFISQEVGVNKPAREYFTRCFAQIPDFDPKQAMIVGDSLTSDILGGINAGITTCWVNPAGKPGRPDISADYEICFLRDLEALLETIG